MKRKTKQMLWLAAGFLAAVVLDQWTKWLAVVHLKGNGPVILWEGVFELFYSENRGAAFGMLQGKQWFFAIIGIAVLAVVAYMLIRMPASRKYLPLEFTAMFIAAGAVGNMIDRILQGYVVDFLYFSLINFPIFNVADCYVTVSTFVLVLLLLFYYKEEDLECFSIGKKGDKN